MAAAGLSGEAIRRIVGRAGRDTASQPRGRPVDVADDDDGSPFDGMHHALREDDDARDADDGDGATQSR